MADEKNVSTGAKQKTGDKVATEAPKPATQATTVVDTPAKEKKPRAPKGTASYRILDGVDVTKFNGQRAAVVKALQKLSAEQGADKFFTVEEIAKNIEGLASKHPVEASAAWHLKQMTALKVVAEQITPAPAAAEPAKDKAAA